ncbi:MAG: YbaN family protein [Thiolinea sp.]
MSAPKITKPLFFIAGWVCFALGFIGIFLPLLPTTIFWILAAGCWSKSHPELAQRILSHPRFGQPIQLFLDQRQISRKGKCFASAGITFGYFIFLLSVNPSWMVAGITGLILAAVIAWIISLDLPAENAERLI